MVAGTHALLGHGPPGGHGGGKGTFKGLKAKKIKGTYDRHSNRDVDYAYATRGQQDGMVSPTVCERRRDSPVPRLHLASLPLRSASNRYRRGHPGSYRIILILSTRYTVPLPVWRDQAGRFPYPSEIFLPSSVDLLCS